MAINDFWVLLIRSALVGAFLWLSWLRLDLPMWQIVGGAIVLYVVGGLIGAVVLALTSPSEKPREDNSDP